MTDTLTVTLAPGGGLSIHSAHSQWTVPMTLQGLAIIRHVLQERTRTTERRIGTPAVPVQSLVDAWMRGPAGRGPRQLAGDTKRRAEIRGATGVEVRQGKKTKSTGLNLDLANIDL